MTQSLRTIAVHLMPLIYGSMAWSQPNLHVLVDPGHGGHDQGAHGPAGVLEADLTLQISKLLAQNLNQTPGLTAALTRTNNNFMSLEARTLAARKSKAQVLISIHANWSRDTRAQGAELYFQNHLPPDEESMYLANLENQAAKSGGNHLPNESHFASDLKPDVLAMLEDLVRSQRILSSAHLARSLKKSWSQSIPRQKVSLRQAPFFVVSQVGIPSVLVELGFLSNPREAKLLSHPSHQAQLARTLTDGLKLFKEELDKLKSSSL